MLYYKYICSIISSWARLQDRRENGPFGVLGSQGLQPKDYGDDEIDEATGAVAGAAAATADEEDDDGDDEDALR